MFLNLEIKMTKSKARKPKPPSLRNWSLQTDLGSAVGCEDDAKRIVTRGTHRRAKHRRNSRFVGFVGDRLGVEFLRWDLHRFPLFETGETVDQCLGNR